MGVKAAFQSEIITLDLNMIVPTKTITAEYRKTATYKRIAASLHHVGLIEPLVVFPSKDKYLLLDGHTRRDILLASNTLTAKCLLATDNEAYTYNRRVNYVPPIAQQHMILCTLEHVTEDRIANALNVSVATIREKRNLLTGICPETVELLRNERVSADAFACLRKMKPVRQIAVARLMISTRKFSGRFARALLESSNDDQRITSSTCRQKRKMTTAQQALIQQETNEFLKHVDAVTENYGNDVIHLTAACRYLERLLENSRIQKYLGKHHSETLAALEQLLTDVQNDKRQRTAAKGARTGKASSG
jgi:hypothetical protein